MVPTSESCSESYSKDIGYTYKRLMGPMELGPVIYIVLMYMHIVLGGTVVAGAVYSTLIHAKLENYQPVPWKSILTVYLSGEFFISIQQSA